MRFELCPTERPTHKQTTSSSKRSIALHREQKSSGEKNRGPHSTARPLLPSSTFVFERLSRRNPAVFCVGQPGIKHDWDHFVPRRTPPAVAQFSRFCIVPTQIPHRRGVWPSCDVVLRRTLVTRRYAAMPQSCLGAASRAGRLH